jgi:hypothetical protein
MVSIKFLAQEQGISENGSMSISTASDHPKASSLAASAASSITASVVSSILILARSSSGDEYVGSCADTR